MRKAMCVPGALLLGLALWVRGAAALDLETVLRQVAADNPQIAAGRDMVAAARARVAPAGAWSSPMVELGVVNVPPSLRSDVEPMTMKMVGVSQRVPLFGGNRLARGSAIAASRARGAAVEATRQQMMGMAWESYGAAFYAAGMARQAEAHIGAMDRLVQAARARYQSGRGRLEEVLRAEAERARVLSDAVGFRARERSARAQLDALRGVMASGDPEALVPPPEPPVPASAEAWLAALDTSHPRLRELEAEAGRYRLGARAARRSLWPDLELRGSYGFRDPVVAPHGTTPQDDLFSATVGFMVPIFAGSRELSEAAEMDAMARASESERRAAELDLRRDIASAWIEAEAAERIVHLLADTVVTTQRRAVEASWAAYSAAATDLSAVFEANHALYSEELALLGARVDKVRAQARFVSLTGRGDLVGLPLPARLGGEP